MTPMEDFIRRVYRASPRPGIEMPSPRGARKLRDAYWGWLRRWKPEYPENREKREHGAG